MKNVPSARIPSSREGREMSRAATLPLRRLGLVFVLATSIGLSLVVAGILVINARGATRDEVGTAYGLAAAYLDEFRSRLATGPRPMEDALSLARQIDMLRHVRAEVRAPDGHLIGPRGPGGDVEEAPEWFLDLIAGPEQRVEAPVTRYPNTLATVSIATDYRDEAAEVWSDFRAIIAVIGVMSAVTVLATFLVLHLVRRRLLECVGALRAISEGDFTAAPAPQRLAELDALARGIGALARALGAREEENRLLQERLMTLSDSERRQVASDLHDGLGPLLFALRTAVSEAREILRRAGPVAVSGRAGLPPKEVTPLIEELDAIGTHAQALQGMVRGVIFRLRPMIEADASLSDLLADFAAGFGEVAPEARVRLVFGPGAGAACGESAGLAIMRFAQESALNAVRHGRAREITVTGSSETGADGVTWIRVEVADDGRGPAPTAAPRYGQTGILDRARALGGLYERPARVGALTRTRLALPLREAGRKAAAA
jgi:two-component system sensor histidine kinase UhpB